MPADRARQDTALRRARRPRGHSGRGVARRLIEEYGPQPHDLVEKITGSVDKPLDRIKAFKNDPRPKYVVTVDLLTTGIDVPAITNLVFVRRVNSRILYDQMIGRATRRCDEIGKEYFRIFDAVDIYANLQEVTDMRPVVVDPALSFATLIGDLQRADDRRGSRLRPRSDRRQAAATRSSTSMLRGARRWRPCSDR